MIQIINIQSLDIIETSFHQLMKQFFSDFVIGLGKHFTAGFVNHITCYHATQNKIFRNLDFFESRGFHFTDMLHGDALVFRHNHLAALADIKPRYFATQTFRNQFKLNSFFAEVERIERKELLKYFFCIVAKGTQ